MSKAKVDQKPLALEIFAWFWNTIVINQVELSSNRCFA